MTKPGFAPDSRTLSPRGSVPTNLTVLRQVEQTRESVTVGASDQAMLVDTEETGSHVQINHGYDSGLVAGVVTQESVA